LPFEAKVYYDSYSDAWIVRYVVRGIKKKRSFSCKKYGKEAEVKANNFPTLQAQW
jgi:hypothetical protein